MFVSYLLPTALLAVTAVAAVQTCQKGYCCDGKIIQTGSSDDFSPSAFSCCKGGDGSGVTSGPNSPKKCTSGDQIPLTDAGKKSGGDSDDFVSVSIPAVATPTLGGSSIGDNDSSSTITSSSTSSTASSSNGDSANTSSSDGEQTSATSSNGDSASTSSDDGDSTSESDSSESNGAAASFDTGLANSLLGIVGAIAAAPVLIGAL